MAVPRILSDLIGTMQTYFKIATVRLKDSSSVLHIRNAGDTAFANAKAHTLEIAGSNASNVVSITAPAGLGGNVALTLPNSDGVSGQVLKTDGSGVLDWVDAVSNGQLEQVEAFTQASSSPLAIFTPPANSTIRKVSVHVTSAAAGGSPTLNIGTAGDPDRDMDETEINLLVAGVYEVNPNSAVGGSPAEIQAAIVPDGQTFGGNIYVTYSTPA